MHILQYYLHSIDISMFKNTLEEENFANQERNTQKIQSQCIYHDPIYEEETPQLKKGITKKERTEHLKSLGLQESTINKNGYKYALNMLSIKIALFVIRKPNRLIRVN